jgi:urease accessory protein
MMATKGPKVAEKSGVLETPPSASPAPAVAKFSGHLSLRAAVRHHGRTVLAGQSFRAPFHISKPYWDADARALLVQVVNPTAGILSGDRLESDIAVERDAALLVTTPSASRVFRMRDGAAECRQQFSVAAGGWLEVMPEPLVPHRASRYHQRTAIDVADGGALFFVDQLLPGRIGHGEAWQWERLCLELTVRVAGELVLRERLDQTGEELLGLATLAGSGPTACFANALLVAPEASFARWREELLVLHRNGTWLGVSALRRGGWSIKVVAPDALHLRQTLREMRRVLARHFPRLTCDPRKL